MIVRTGTSPVGKQVSTHSLWGATPTALKWLNQTLLDLDGQAKRVGESDSAYENRLTSRWLGRARLSVAQRRTVAMSPMD